MSVEHPNRHASGTPSGARRVASAMGAAAARSRRLVRSSVIGLTVMTLGAGALSISSAQAAETKAAPGRVCNTVLSTGTEKAVLLSLPATGGTGADSYDDGYLAPAKASEWTDYSLEGDATTTNTLAVSFRQNANNGPSLQFAAGKNSLGPLRLNNGGWAADGNVALPVGTLTPGEPFRFKIDVSGQQVTVRIDGVQVAQYTRPWLPASGTIGIRVSGAETGTLDNLVVRRLDTGKYLYADDFEGRASGAAGGTAAGYAGLQVADVCTVPDSPGDAYWIWGEDASSVNNWTAFRKTFTIDDVEALPQAVNARIAAETKYWLYVNDELVVFEGGVKRGPNKNDSYVDNVDLRPHLKDGENTLALLAVSYGRGGYAGPYAGRAGLFFEADDIDLRSNSSWKALKIGAYGSMSVDTNYRLAEPNVKYDARAEIGGWGGWQSAGFDDADWPAAVTAGNEGSAPWNLLVDSPIPLLKFDEEFTKVSTTDPKVKVSSNNGITTYELRMPVNHQLTPYVKLGADTQAGKTVGLLTDRATVRGSGVEQAVQAQYVTKAGAQEYESLVWMNGDKLFVTAPSGVQVEEFGYRLSGYATEFDGSFSSDDEYMNKLWTMARDTLYVTMRDSYMDCPDRERSQWWGDATNELEEAFYALDPAAAALARKGITNLMGFRNGDLIPTQAPAASFSELPAQSLAGVMSFWMFYEYSGDKSVLDETYEPSVAYLRTYNMAADGLLNHDHGGTWHWHDWGQNEDGRLIDTLWYYIALKSTLKSATTLAVPTDDENIAWMQSRVDSIEDNLDKLWVDGKGFYESTGDGKADDRANALAVYAGLAKPEQYEQIRDVLVNIKKSSPYMDKYVLEALYMMGYPDEAMARMKDRYAPMVNDPEHSTLWEFFAGPEQDAAGTFNHAWTGGPLTMMSRYAAGIQPTKPGFAEFAVRPQLGTMKTVAANVHSVNGKIAVAINASNPKSYKLDVTVPESAAAEVHLPTIEVSDATVSGEPLSESAPGVLGVRVDAAAGETVVRMEAGRHSFAVASAPASVKMPSLGTVSPGKDVTGVVTVKNTGVSRIDAISAVVEVPGLVDPVTLSGGPLADGESADLPFTIAVPQGMRNGSSFDAQAEVTVSYGEQERRTVVSTPSFLRVAADVAISSVAVSGRAGDYPKVGQWTVTATVKNNGSTAISGQASARSVPGVLEAGAPSQVVTVPAGESLEVPVTVHGGGEHWLPIMQAPTVDFLDRNSVLATGTSSTRIKWYGPKGQGWNTTGAGAVAGATDFVDFGDGGSGSTGNTPGNVRPGPTELAHNLRWNLRPDIPVGGTNTEAGLTRRFTWSRDGSWYSVDVDVPSGEPFVLSLRETADTSAPSTVGLVQTRPKKYKILVDDVLVRRVTYLMPNEGVVGNTLSNYQVLVDEPDALDTDGDGKVTVKYLYEGGDDYYDPSLTDVWVSPAGAPQADDRAPTVSAAPADSTVYGDNGWITKATTLLVKAVDDVDSSPSVEVALDDAPSAPYTGPVAVDGDGTHVLRYSAKDASSNTSAVQTLTVKLDSTKPVPAFGAWPTGDIAEGEVPDAPACLGTDATSGVGSCVLTGYSKDAGEHTMTQTVIDKAGNRASATLSYVVVAADREALGQALLAQSALVADEYTTSSWAALMSTVEGAQAVYEGSGFSQSQVDAATTAVDAGVTALVKRGDPASLETLLVATRGLLDDLGGYTQASADALRAAVAVAESVYAERADKTDVQLEAAVSALQAAVDGLTAQPEQVEKAVLQHLYDQGRALSNAGGTYTQASWATLQRELAEAGTILADQAATQSQVDQAASELTSALAGLVKTKPTPPKPTVSRVKLNQNQLRLVKGSSFRLEEAVYYTNGAAAYSGAAVWKSSNPKVATVSSTGKIKAKKTGKVTITVTSVKSAASGKKVSTRITVRVVKSRSKAKVKKVTATVPKSMKVGQSVFITGRYSSAAATGVKVRYRTSASNVARIDAAGRVVARKKGTVKITVKAGKVSRTYKITVR